MIEEKAPAETGGRYWITTDHQAGEIKGVDAEFDDRFATKVFVLEPVLELRLLADLWCSQFERRAGALNFAPPGLPHVTSLHTAGGLVIMLEGPGLEIDEEAALFGIRAKHKAGRTKGGGTKAGGGDELTSGRGVDGIGNGIVFCQRDLMKRLRNCTRLESLV